MLKAQVKSIKMGLGRNHFLFQSGLGGVYFWSLEQDDYKNSCENQQGSFPLIRTIYNNLCEQSYSTQGRNFPVFYRSQRKND